MQYIPKVKSTSGLSDGVQKKQRLFSGEKRPNDTVRSSSRKMQVALIHSTSERKRLPRDGRQDKETRPSSVSYTEAKSSRGKSFLSFFPTKVFGSKCEDRQESELIHGYWGRFNEQGWNSLELDGGAPLVLRHLRVGGVWQDTRGQEVPPLPPAGRRRWGRCSQSAVLRACGGDLLCSEWRQWCHRCGQSRPFPVSHHAEGCYYCVILYCDIVNIWYVADFFFFNFPFSFSSLSHVSLTQFS